ncbi:MAG: TIGR02453 family protein [Candidatus Dadabacteria bacterium]|nr:TIGR02453 family protein [Candidatus Dadabacteria bacterium]NIQ13481.1 TIGR02453 family protein [Candidatus Dadabacteria bacterium]
MNNQEKFSGFDKKSVKFFKDLEKNNTREWFDAHRDIYDEYILRPAVLFIRDLGKKLQKISPNFVADPRRDKSIFRIQRDTRFSRDKKPFKTHLGIYFWEGENKKLENPGFYFHFDSKRIMLGGGLHVIPKQYLKTYRDSVVDSNYGSDLVKILKKISKNDEYKAGWEKYKKVPRGYDPDHPNSKLLLNGGIGFIYETKIPEEMFSEELLNFCYKVYKDISPLHFWIIDMIGRSNN